MSFVYDIAEIADLPKFVYDIKILYQLQGHRVKSLQELCGAFLDQEAGKPYHQVCERLRSHIRSYMDCGVSIQDYQIETIIPEQVIEDLTAAKQSVVSALFRRFPDENVIQFYERFFPKLQCLHRLAKNLNLKFNFAGHKTGRLSFKSNTLNPYVMPKSQRSCIKARPGYKIYQYDLKSSQPRIAIFSTCNEAFKQRFVDVEDIYAAFPGDRDDNKTSLLRWMYSVNFSLDEMFGKIAKPIKELRLAVHDSSLRNRVVKNAFGRPLIFSDDERQQPHVVFQRYISSTEADALYEILCHLERELDGTKSRILFPFYDAIIFEICDDDADLPERLKLAIENHYMDHMFYCRFPVDVKVGTDLSSIR